MVLIMYVKFIVRVTTFKFTYYKTEFPTAIYFLTIFIITSEQSREKSLVIILACIFSIYEAYRHKDSMKTLI